MDLLYSIFQHERKETVLQLAFKLKKLTYYVIYFHVFSISPYFFTSTYVLLSLSDIKPEHELHTYCSNLCYVCIYLVFGSFRSYSYSCVIITKEFLFSFKQKRQESVQKLKRKRSERKYAATKHIRQVQKKIRKQVEIRVFGTLSHYKCCLKRNSQCKIVISYREKRSKKKTFLHSCINGGDHQHRVDHQQKITYF